MLRYGWHKGLGDVKKTRRLKRKRGVVEEQATGERGKASANEQNHGGPQGEHTPQPRGAGKPPAQPGSGIAKVVGQKFVAGGADASQAMRRQQKQPKLRAG